MKYDLEKMLEEIRVDEEANSRTASKKKLTQEEIRAMMKKHRKRENGK